MKYLISCACCLVFLCACGGAEPTVVPVTTATALPTPEPVFADTPLPPAYSGPFDLRDPANPREVAAIRLDDPFFTAHNFIVQDNLLLVGWYQDGARVFRYDMTDPAHPEIEQVAYFAVRKHKTSGPYGPFTGLWGLRVHPCSVRGAARTCV